MASKENTSVASNASCDNNLAGSIESVEEQDLLPSEDRPTGHKNAQSNEGPAVNKEKSNGPGGVKQDTQESLRGRHFTPRSRSSHRFNFNGRGARRNHQNGTGRGRFHNNGYYNPSMPFHQDEIINDHHFYEGEHGGTDAKGPPQACLFVASFGAQTTEEDIREVFEAHAATVIKVKILKDRTMRPYAFVQLLKPEDANRLIRELNGYTIKAGPNGAPKRIRVERAKVNRTLFVAKLHREMTNQALRDVVEQFGEVESVTIIKDHQTNKSKGCGFIKFVYREDAMDAFSGLKASQKKWVVEWATSRNDPDLLGVDKYNIFVGGLNPSEITKEMLQERFSSYGEIDTITLINRQFHDVTEGSLPRSAFAFIRFKDHNCSTTAIENENGQEWLHRRIRVQYCESKEMKNKRRANKYFQMGHMFPHATGFGPGTYMPPLPMPYPIDVPPSASMGAYGEFDLVTQIPHAMGVPLPPMGMPPPGMWVMGMGMNMGLPVPPMYGVPPMMDGTFEGAEPYSHRINEFDPEDTDSTSPQLSNTREAGCSSASPLEAGMESLGLSQRGLPGLHGMGGMGMGVPHSPVPVPHLPEFSPPVNGTSTVGNTMRGHPDTEDEQIQESETARVVKQPPPYCPVPNLSIKGQIASDRSPHS